MEILKRSRTYKVGENHSIYIAKNCDHMNESNGNPVWYDIEVYNRGQKIVDASSACLSFQEAEEIALNALYKANEI